MPDEPDFATIYDTSPLAPRMADRLWVVAQLAHDASRQDIADMWLEQLPTVAGPRVWPAVSPAAVRSPRPLPSPAIHVVGAEWGRRVDLGLSR